MGCLVLVGSGEGWEIQTIEETGWGTAGEGWWVLSSSWTGTGTSPLSSERALEVSL